MSSGVLVKPKMYDLISESQIPAQFNQTNYSLFGDQTQAEQMHNYNAILRPMKVRTMIW